MHKIKISIIALISVMIISQCAFAEPLPDIPFEATQADGTVITLQGFGDEYFSWYETTDGYVAAYDSVSENWCYAVIENDTLVPGTQVVKNDDTKTADMLMHEDAAELQRKIVGSVRLTSNDIKISVGDTAELQAFINAFVSDYSNYQFVWTCDNPQIVSIDVEENGRTAAITANEAGTATVSVTVTGGSGEANNTAICTISVDKDSAEPEYSYEITSLKLTDMSGTEITAPSTGQSFEAEATVSKTALRDGNDYIFVAVYDKAGALLSLDYVKANLAVGEYSFGFNIPAQRAEIGSVKAFVWSSFASSEPLAEAKTLTFPQVNE